MQLLLIAILVYITIRTLVIFRKLTKGGKSGKMGGDDFKIKKDE